MKILLDTHLLLWAVGQSSRLPESTTVLLDDPENVLVFSSVNIWEVAIKSGLGRAHFKFDPRILRRTLLDQGYEELPVRSEHAIAVSDLPPIHEDPFDRILIAQSLVEGLMLLTSDPTVARYSGSIRKV